MEGNVLLRSKELLLRSSSEIVIYSFQWTIENFSFYENLLNEYEAITSPLLDTQDNKFRWRIDLYFDGECKDSVGFISANLFDDEGEDKYTAKVALTLMNCPSLCRSEVITKDSSNGWKYLKFLKREDLFKDPEFLKTDCLTILCEIKVLALPSSVVVLNKTINTLSKDLKNLVEKSDFYDLTLIVGENKFDVHKFILAARSSVFASMFSQTFGEIEPSIIEIEGTSPAVMEEIIHYIYTDEFPKLKELVEEVVFIADKYAFIGLKDMCAKELYSRLTVENAAHILLLADMYNVTNLKENIINFIVINSCSVVATSTWIEMKKNNHPLITEVELIFLAKSHVTALSTTN